MHQFALKSLCKHTSIFSVEKKKIKQVTTLLLLVTHLYEGWLRIKENPLLGQGTWREWRVERRQKTHTDILLKTQAFSKQSGIIHLSQILEFCLHYCQYFLHLGSNSQSISRQCCTASVSEHTEVNLLANGISHILKS